MLNKAPDLFDFREPFRQPMAQDLASQSPMGLPAKRAGLASRKSVRKKPGSATETWTSNG